MMSYCIFFCCCQDPRAAARYGDRVPYVVVCGEPTARLVDLVVSPHDVLRNPHKMRINAKYYITKQLIPVLARVFNLVGASISKWYDDMPRPVSRSAHTRFQLFNESKNPLLPYYTSFTE